MTAHKLDALVAPTSGPASLIDLVNGDGGTSSAASPSTVTSVAGYPHITVPAGYFRGLPVGISFFGRAWSEAPRSSSLLTRTSRPRSTEAPPAFAATADLAKP